MDIARLHASLLALDCTRGEETRDLTIGTGVLRLVGLDGELADLLATRWGAFLGAPTSAEPRYTLRLLRGGATRWLDPPLPSERYRIEAHGAGAGRVVVSYHFALCAGAGPRSWRVALTDEPHEPIERILDNVARYLTARMAAEAGGFALHGAGVLREGRAFVFAGPSRAGKSTAVALSAPGRSLGDDFAVVLPLADGWGAAAVPFDNSERIAGDPPRGTFPLAGVFRLYKADESRLDQPPAGVAVASLMACLAFPWALPELAEPLLEQVRSFVGRARFAHLHFRRDPEFWSVLLRNAP